VRRAVQVVAFAVLALSAFFAVVALSARLSGSLAP
jgi:hypothetical protein